MAGVLFLSNKIEIYEYFRKLRRLLISSNFNVTCQTLPRCCSQDSPGGWIKIIVLKIVDKYHRKIHRKLGWLINNGRDI